MSGSTMSTFRYGPLRGWSLNVSYRWGAGELEYATVVLEASRDSRGAPVAGGVAVAPRVEGYDLVRDLLVNGDGGHDRQLRVAQWLIGAMREAVEHGVWGGLFTLPEVTANIWRNLVEKADESHADHYGRFGDLDPDTIVSVETHPFKVVNTWIFDRLALATA
jgi:hypothetical protein